MSVWLLLLPAVLSFIEHQLCQAAEGPSIKLSSQCFCVLCFFWLWGWPHWFQGNSRKMKTPLSLVGQFGVFAILQQMGGAGNTVPEVCPEMCSFD